ncbi:MAG: potassium transporter TrkG [Candidatus Izemoplasmatales bacterium]|jgi:trk system potassium uptake protein TrkH|nr:potassium transporter TrkG [Candidatus Izemoplasmatales bacterium]
MIPKKVVSGYPLLLGYLGYFLMMIGMIILIPLLTIFFYPEEAGESKSFIIPGVVAVIIGYLLSLILRGKETAKLDRHQDTLLIFLFWIVAIFISAFPFILSGNYNFTQAIFESTSGYSTTGLTVVDVTISPKTFLLYRSLLQFFGGVGLVLVLTSAISDKYGMKLYHAEGHNDKLLPNLAKSARLILSIYSIYIIIGSILYTVFGMNFFDAINHSIASVSTGGFSTKADSIGHYQSFPIELITIVLMLLGSTNLIIHLLIFKAKFKKAFHHIEVKLLIAITIIFLPIITISFMHFSGDNFLDSLRFGVFQFVSSVTTTGFQTVEQFSGLPHIINYSVIILMIIGGGIGSTSGGIKQYRVGLLLKNMFWNIRDKMSHQRTIYTNYIQKYGKDIEITPDELQYNQSFILLYLSILAFGTLVFSLYGYTLEESLFEFASALGTVGLSIGVISYHLEPVLLWVSAWGMIMGRLEFYIIIMAFSKLMIDLTKKKGL